MSDIADDPWTIFLDRDGTVIVDSNYPSDPDAVQFEVNAKEGLGLFAAAQTRLVIVSNQSGIGRGYFPESAAHNINERLARILSAQNIQIEGWYICPHKPEDQCECRKPLPGLAYRAARELGIDLKRAIMIGDKISDLGMATALGMPGILVRTGKGEATARAATSTLTNTFIVNDLVEAFTVYSAIRAKICVPGTHERGRAK
jgi:D-glycero-D-manno-heptose 1,7-bisphosphate phosphatase